MFGGCRKLIHVRDQHVGSSHTLVLQSWTWGCVFVTSRTQSNQTVSFVCKIDLVDLTPSMKISEKSQTFDQWSLLPFRQVRQAVIDAIKDGGHSAGPRNRVRRDVLVDLDACRWCCGLFQIILNLKFWIVFFRYERPNIRKLKRSRIYTFLPTGGMRGCLSPCATDDGYTNFDT